LTAVTKKSTCWDARSGARDDGPGDRGRKADHLSGLDRHGDFIEFWNQPSLGDDFNRTTAARYPVEED
jgi:hypothetical protein